MIRVTLFAVVGALLGVVDDGAWDNGEMLVPSATYSLDGEQWLLATDAANAGRQEKWFAAPRAEARSARVPWIIQDAFPGYHGVAWYWRQFDAPVNPHPGGRYLLRFWAVDYTAEVWLNGERIGEHEGGESPFTLDATAAIRPGEANLLAVRVLNPTHEPIDGIVLNETPHRNKALPYTAGSAWDQGGIIDSVELMAVPATRVDDLFVRPEWKTGRVAIDLEVFCAGDAPGSCRVEYSIAPAASGATCGVAVTTATLKPGANRLAAELRVDQPRLWELNDPFLYRVTARVRQEGSQSVDERSVRCGFRDFRFENGYFRLNGRRLYLRCSHTGNCCPVGLELPHDPDLLRRDLLNVKAMRFNAIRFIAGVAKRYQLDLCDEIGLLVYEEPYAAWLLQPSPHMARRYDESILGMVGRDRNHASVVIWGLLNETPDGPVFRHAVDLLPELRGLDETRLVMLNSGRWDRSASAAGIQAWRGDSIDPNVTFNSLGEKVESLGITWAPGQVALHPGEKGEYSVLRWTAPAAGSVAVAAEFRGIAERATTDAHVLHNGRPVFGAGINVDGGGNEARYQGKLDVQPGDTLDCAVGFGNGNYGGDTTAVALVIEAVGGKTFDAAKEFSLAGNPNGPWSYGTLAPGAEPDAGTFAAYARGAAEKRVGSLANPGSTEWEDVLSDQHPYQRVPHTAEIIHRLRTLDGKGLPVLVSEYGIGSAVDLLRVTRNYEQIGKTEVEDYQFYRALREQFLVDWQRWRMDEAFTRPEDFFAASLAKMADGRRLGINALRSNPNVIGYSLTGTVDQGMTGEGLTTTFREFKPGTMDAVFDAFAPLRWCLFVEPVHVYRGQPVRIEAVLANEDALRPGDYPVRFEIFGADGKRVYEKKASVTIPERSAGEEPPMVTTILAEDVTIDAPAGRCRFTATFEQGAAAAGEAVEFYLADPAGMPEVEQEVVLWGEDAELRSWLESHGIKTRPFKAEAPAERETILVSRRPAAPDGAAAFAELAGRMSRGATVVFLSAEVFAAGDRPTAWLPLAEKGTVARIPSWLYLKDDWAKPHAIFEGLPTGMLDPVYYRELIPDTAWVGQSPPKEAVAGGINAAQAYSSGLLVAVYEFGAGRFVINTFRIREELGKHPVAERLLRNMLRFAASPAGTTPADLPTDFEDQLRSIGYQ